MSFQRCIASRIVIAFDSGIVFPRCPAQVTALIIIESHCQSVRACDFGQHLTNPIVKSSGCITENKFAACLIRYRGYARCGSAFNISQCGRIAIGIANAFQPPALRLPLGVVIAVTGRRIEAETAVIAVTDKAAMMSAARTEATLTIGNK